MNRTKPRLYHGFFIVAFLLSSFALIFTFAVNFPRFQKTPSKSFTFCLPCSHLIPTTAEVQKEPRSSAFNTYDKNDTGMCCANNASQASIMIQSQMERYALSQHRDVVMSSYGFSASAHKLLIYPEGKEDRQTLRIRTGYNDPIHEHVNNVALIPTGLEVNYTGLYYVYKSILFQPDTDKACGMLNIPAITTTLTKRNEDDVIDLLTSSHTCCPGCKHNRETTFVGGIFELNKGDIIQVHVAAEDLVDFNEDVSFVGLMMIHNFGK